MIRKYARMAPCDILLPLVIRHCAMIKHVFSVAETVRAPILNHKLLRPRRPGSPVFVRRQHEPALCALDESRVGAGRPPSEAGRAWR
eukprot:6200985-Pleurochrysis_carterae.AAC.3